MLAYLWIALMAVAIILEVVFRRGRGASLVPGALIALLLSVYERHPLYQLLAFFLLSCVPLAVIMLMQKKHTASRPQTLDAMIGKRATVVETIENVAGSGEVEIDGNVWSARAVLEDEVYERGEVLSVVAIEGVTVICKK